MQGTRLSLAMGISATAISLAVGVPIGLVAGYREGVVDTLVMRLIDVVLAFPAILLAMGLIAVIGAGWGNGALAVTIVSVPAFARLTRASVLQEKTREYVMAARTAGASTPRLLVRTILPNCLGPLLVQVAFVATWAILLEAALSFLGLGAQPPTPSLGVILADGRNYLSVSPWPVVTAGIALACVVLLFNSLGDRLRDRLDPRGRSRP